MQLNETLFKRFKRVLRDHEEMHVVQRHRTRARLNRYMALYLDRLDLDRLNILKTATAANQQREQ